MRYLKILTLIALPAVIIASCRPATYVPKPRGYYRFDLPEHAYRTFDSSSFPYQFEYPVYGRISQDMKLNQEEHSPYWINLEFSELNAAIYLSYKKIGPEETFDKLVEESYKLSYAHEIRADYIKTPAFRTPNGLIGVTYSVGGNAASAYQFFITDSTKNFIRGALYFNVSPNADSLQPASEFLKKDMDHLIETIRFR